MNDLWTAAPVAALSESRALFELGLIVVLAAAAPLAAQVLRLPSILMLLAFGFGAGAIGALDPDALLGQRLISAVVSVAVGIILFEAGLGLDVRQLTGGVARVVRRLVTVGILVTWAVGTVGARLLLDLSWDVALVLGAVLVVSGPTVVGPLLGFIRPSRTVSSVLKWEGTLADPIGATLGVVVFTAVVAGQAEPGEEIVQFLLSIAAGAGAGLAGAAVMFAWAFWLRPTRSQAIGGTLMAVVAAVVGADLLRHDAGLIAGLVMGAILANQAPGRLEPAGLAIQTAKLTRTWHARIEELSAFLIGILFVILSARVSPDEIGDIGWVSVAFVVVLVLVGRPLAVAISTLGSELPLRERAFVAWMAPRGIVAAAASSTFALGLTEAGVGGGAEKLVPISFVAIVATALVYGLTGGVVARALRVGRSGPGGVLLVGATPVARAIGRALRDHGLSVVVWTGSEESARAVGADGLAVYAGDPTADADRSAPSELDEVDKVLVVTADDAVNAIIATDLSEFFGRDRVFQIAPGDQRTRDLYTRARVLFDDAASHDEMLARIEAGAEITVIDAGTSRPGTDLLPMFVVTPGRDLRVLAAGDRPDLAPGQQLIGLAGGTRRAGGARR